MAEEAIERILRKVDVIDTGIERLHRQLRFARMLNGFLVAVIVGEWFLR